MVQEFLTERLRNILPEARFLGEENGMDLFTSEDAEVSLFVIDPIDGTTNFIHNLHPHVTSIGLSADGQPRAGVVYAPVTDQLFSAQRGEGALREWRPDPFLQAGALGQYHADRDLRFLHERLCRQPEADLCVSGAVPGLSQYRKRAGGLCA